MEASEREPRGARRRKDSAAAAAVVVAVVDIEEGSPASAERRIESFAGEAGSPCTAAGAEQEPEGAAGLDIQYTAVGEELVRSPLAEARSQSVAVGGTAVEAAGELLQPRRSLHIVAGPVEGCYCRQGTSSNSSTFWAAFIASLATPEAAGKEDSNGHDMRKESGLVMLKVDGASID